MKQSRKHAADRAINNADFSGVSMLTPAAWHGHALACSNIGKQVWLGQQVLTPVAKHMFVLHGLCIGSIKPARAGQAHPMSILLEAHLCSRSFMLRCNHDFLRRVSQMRMTQLDSHRLS